MRCLQAMHGVRIVDRPDDRPHAGVVSPGDEVVPEDRDAAQPQRDVREPGMAVPAAGPRGEAAQALPASLDRNTPSSLPAIRRSPAPNNMRFT